MALTTTTGAGLEGVVAGESEICFIDGDEGILSYRGYNIHTLADNATFEEVIFLLWNGRLPRRDELEPVEGGPGSRTGRFLSRCWIFWHRLANPSRWTCCARPFRC